VGKEKVGVEDDVSLVLYDENGKAKQVSSSKKRKKRLQEIIKKVLENW